MAPDKCSYFLTLLHPFHPTGLKLVRTQSQSLLPREEERSCTHRELRTPEQLLILHLENPAVSDFSAVFVSTADMQVFQKCAPERPRL